MKKVQRMRGELHPCRTMIFLPVLLIVLVIALGPYLVLGTQARVVFHDHLDANFAWAVVLAREGQIFASATDIVAPILGGLERQFLGSQWELYYWIFHLLPPFSALVASEALTRTIAFAGAYQLMRWDILGRSDDKSDAKFTFMIAAGAGAFALLPFWLPGGTTVAGLPLFLWAVFRLRAWQCDAWVLVSSTLCVLLFVFYGSFVLSGIFVLFLLGFLVLFDLLARKKYEAVRLFCVLTVASSLFIAKERWLVALMISERPTSREEFTHRTYGSDKLFETFRTSFLDGQYHADPGTAWPMFSAVAVALLIASVLAVKGSWQDVRRPVKWLFVGLFATGLTALFYALFRWEGFADLPLPGKLSSFNFGRFHWLQPGLWFVSFAAALAIISLGTRSTSIYSGSKPIIRQAGVMLATALCLVQIGINIIALPVYGGSKRALPYEQFLASQQFVEIRQDLAGYTETPKLALLGAHPAIAQYNGFETLGGYVQLYPLDQKHRLREVFRAELDASNKLKRYFDGWGNRAYVFNADLEKCVGNCFADRAPDQIRIRIDVKSLRAEGVTHVLSVSEIANPGKLTLLNAYSSPEGQRGWRFFLYELQ